MTNNGKTFVNTLLSAEQLAELVAIQDYYGIESRGETIRLLIRRESRRLAMAGRTGELVGGWLAGQVTAEEAMRELATSLGG